MVRIFRFLIIYFVQLFSKLQFSLPTDYEELDRAYEFLQNYNVEENDTASVTSTIPQIRSNRGMNKRCKKNNLHPLNENSFLLEGKDLFMSKINATLLKSQLLVFLISLRMQNSKINAYISYTLMHELYCVG